MLGILFYACLNAILKKNEAPQLCYFFLYFVYIKSFPYLCGGFHEGCVLNPLLDIQMVSYLLLYLFLALGISFLCSVLESTLMSTTLSYINLREEDGYKPATLMKRYKTETERPLAAILSLNTIANTVGAAGVGQQASLVFGNQWFGLASFMMTLLILVFSEIIPKTIGTTYWKQLMGFAAHVIRVLIVVMFPIVKFIELISRLFPEPDEAAVSREEVVAMANVGEEEGVIEEDENKIIRNVMRLNEVKAYEVMTPRVVAATAPEKMTLKEYYDSDRYDHFSRIPVYADSPEFITGYDIFDKMLKEKSQIGVIIDEYGCFQGILTLEDVIETIFGLEIIDEMDVVPDMQAYARERWQQRQKRYKPLSTKDSPLSQERSAATASAGKPSNDDSIAESANSAYAIHEE